MREMLCYCSSVEDGKQGGNPSLVFWNPSLSLFFRFLPSLYLPVTYNLLFPYEPIPAL